MRLAFLVLVAAVGTVSGVSAQDQLFSSKGPPSKKTDTKWEVPEGESIRITSPGCTSWIGDGEEDKKLLIYIPGLTMVFVPVTDIEGLPLQVPKGLQSPFRTVWVTSGPYYRDGNREWEREVIPSRARCGPTDAADLRVLRISDKMAESPPPFTLVSRDHDADGLARNPEWSHPEPDACVACGGFPIDSRTKYGHLIPLDGARCTWQRPFVDAGECQFDFTNCRNKGRLHHLSGHLDWGPAVVTGTLCGGEVPCNAGDSSSKARPVVLNDDGDIELLVVPDGGKGTTHQSLPEYKGKIGLEFSSAETTKWFFSRWWSEFPFARSSYKVLEKRLASFLKHWHKNRKRQIPDLCGFDVVAVGLFGLDNEHDAHAELHPVYGLALRTSTGDEDVWEVFARSWGTGGSCGTNLRVEIDSPFLTLELPFSSPSPTTAARVASVQGELYDHGTEVDDDKWSVYPRRDGIQLVLPLRDLPYGECGFVEGEIRVRKEPADAPVGGVRPGKALRKEPYLAIEPPMLSAARRPQKTWFLGGEGHHCTTSSPSDPEHPFPKEW